MSSQRDEKSKPATGESRPSQGATQKAKEEEFLKVPVYVAFFVVGLLLSAPILVVLGLLLLSVVVV